MVLLNMEEALGIKHELNNHLVFIHFYKLKKSLKSMPCRKYLEVIMFIISKQAMNF
jgi:hypothetical protein